MKIKNFFERQLNEYLNNKIKTLLNNKNTIILFNFKFCLFISSKDNINKWN